MGLNIYFWMHNGWIAYEESWHIIGTQEYLNTSYLTKILQETEWYVVGVRIRISTWEKIHVLPCHTPTLSFLFVFLINQLGVKWDTACEGGIKKPDSDFGIITTFSPSQ